MLSYANGNKRQGDNLSPWLRVCGQCGSDHDNSAVNVTVGRGAIHSLTNSVTSVGHASAIADPRSGGRSPPERAQTRTSNPPLPFRHVPLATRTISHMTSGASPSMPSPRQATLKNLSNSSCANRPSSTQCPRSCHHSPNPQLVDRRTQFAGLEVNGNIRSGEAAGTVQPL